MKTILVVLIRTYQVLISPLFPPTCRFTPSCSTYALHALKAHGICSGIALSISRVLKCHPFHPGGVDPVPPVKEVKQN